MSYSNRIDIEIVKTVLDDLGDNNAHTLHVLLASHYGLPDGIPQGEFNKAYRAAQWVIESWRIEKWKREKDLTNA